MSAPERSGLSADFEKAFPEGPRVRAALSVPGQSGPVTILFGPSGVGKTTVLRCLAGLERLTRGRILFDGDTWADAETGLSLAPQRRPVGYLPQDYALFPHLTVRGNVGYNLGGVAGARRAARVEDLLRRFGIEHLADRRPHEISGGQQQRVGLARALARHPKLLLLDEPLSALDIPTRTQVRAELRTLLRSLGIPVIVITHDWIEALALGDDLAVMGSEGILQCGPPQEVFTRPTHLEVAEAVGVETIVVCRLQGRDEGMLLLGAGPHRVSVVDPGASDSEFYLCLRGEDVMLEKGAIPRSSARNHLPGRISEISAHGPLKKVVVDVGFPMVALVTRQAADDLELAEGDEVTAAFKASAAHLIPRSAASLS